MNYEFPVIRHIDDIRLAIKNHPEFFIAERDGFQVVNYTCAHEASFDNVISWDGDRHEPCPIRRELRGIKFDKEGNIIARPFHKFFNLGEKAETMPSKINLDSGFEVLDKMDGSMIHPMWIKHDGTKSIVWCTKMGPTEVAQLAADYVKTQPSYTYHGFADLMLKLGQTPIFEFCSRDNRIVIDYEQPQMVLLAIRDMVTGAYVPYHELVDRAQRYGIPVVGSHTDKFNSIQGLAASTREAEDIEGYVVRFDNGHMLKIKSSWYVKIHKAKEALLFEKDVVSLLCDDKVDDLKPFLTEPDLKRLNKFETSFGIGLLTTSNELNLKYKIAYSEANGDKKAFALLVNQMNPVYRPIMFRAFISGLHPDFESLVKDMIRKNVSSQSKVDGIRYLWKNISY